MDHYLVRYQLTQLRTSLAMEEESYLQAVKENKEMLYIDKICLRLKDMQKDLEIFIQNILN